MSSNVPEKEQIYSLLDSTCN